MSKFKPGQSGNMAGRPKNSVTGAARFKEYLEEEGGLDKLFALASSEEESIRLDTLKFLTDRAYGKAPQALKHSGLGGTAAVPYNEFIIALADSINARRKPS